MLPRPLAEKKPKHLDRIVDVGLLAGDEIGVHDGCLGPQEAVVGRRSSFTSQQKAEVVLTVLQKRMTMAEVCRKHGITETTFMRWRQQALDGMTRGLEDKVAGGRREVELEREIAELERQLRRMTSIADLRGKFLMRLP